MNVKLALWELGKIYELKDSLECQGRTLNYTDSNRENQLRKFLDSQDQPAEPETEKTETEITF